MPPFCRLVVVGDGCAAARPLRTTLRDSRMIEPCWDWSFSWERQLALMPPASDSRDIRCGARTSSDLVADSSLLGVRKRARSVGKMLFFDFLRSGLKMWICLTNETFRCDTLKKGNKMYGSSNIYVNSLRLVNSSFSENTRSVR